MRLEVLEDRSLPSFSSITSYAAGSSPNAVALGDFNNDTRLDLAVVNNVGNSVSVLLGKADGTFGPAVNASTGAGPVSLAVGDFNGDGKLDIVTANNTDISVLLGNGDGTMQAARSVVLPGEFPPGYTGGTALPQRPVSVAVGDFNADGKLDLTASGVTAFSERRLKCSYSNYGGGCYYYDYSITNAYANVLLGNGDGSFTSSDAKLLNGENLSSVAVADFNGDAKPDLALSVNGLLTTLAGNGDGTLQAPVSSGYLFAASVAVGDFNADGKPDLAATRNYDSVGVSLGNGDGTLQTAKYYYLGLGSSALSVAVGDINADGRLDLVATSNRFTCTDPYCYDVYYTGYVNVLLGYGDGTFAAAQATTLASTNPAGVALGDLNGDGRLDVATANLDTNNATVLINAGDWVLPPPTLSINDVTVTEGNTGTVNAVFTVSLSAAWDQTVTVHYSTADNTATTAGNDYQTKSGTLTFNPGVTSQTISVVVNGDRVGETDESFFVNLDSPTVATVADGQGVGTILDDEPRITISDVSLNEGNSGTTKFNFTVSLSAAYDAPVTVSYATANGTATVANKDYQTKSGTVTFAAGVTSQTVTILVNGDKTKEADETFYVNLSNPVSALITDSQGVGTILNDDRGGKAKASTAAAPSASGVEDVRAALLAGGMPAASLPAAPPAVAPPRKASAVDQVFAALGGQALQTPLEYTKGHARATDPWAEVFADHGLVWNERVPGEIVL